MYGCLASSICIVLKGLKSWTILRPGTYSWAALSLSKFSFKLPDEITGILSKVFTGTEVPGMG